MQGSYAALSGSLCLPLSESRHVKVQGDSEEQPTSCSGSQDSIGVGVPTRVGELHDSGGKTERQDVLASDNHDQGGTSVVSHGFNTAIGSKGLGQTSSRTWQPETASSDSLGGSDDQGRDEKVGRHVLAEDDGEPVDPGGGIGTETVHQDGSESEDTGNNHSRKLEENDQYLISRRCICRNVFVNSLDVREDAIRGFVEPSTS
jgi:hypothetical protein